MKVELQGGMLWVEGVSDGRPEDILAQKREACFSAFSSLGGDSCSGPQRSRARVLVARRSEPLTARTAANH
jgi:hypothetical protein